MSDYMVRFLSREAGVRGFLVESTGMAREAGRRHGLSPLATAALGYGLTGAVLMGALLKVQQRVALKIEGDGPLGKIVCESDSYGRVRGYLVEEEGATEDDGALSEAAVARAIGQRGKLTVVKDLHLRSLYQSVISLNSGYLDGELTDYLTRSEQTPSHLDIVMRLGADGQIQTMAGLLLQTLPREEDSETLEELVAQLQDLPPLETMLAANGTPETILPLIFGDTDYELLETRLVGFSCTCSWERSRQALKLVGAEEVRSLIEEGEAVVDCHFCHERYIFSTDDLEAILAELA